MEDEQMDDDTDIGMESETQGDEEESDEDPSSSPALSAASTPPYTAEEGFFPPPKKSCSSGKPLSLRRGRGRPKKDMEKKPLGIKLKRWKSGVYVKGDPSVCNKQPRTPNSAPDTPQSQKSPCESPIHTSNAVLENECKELTINLGEKIEKIEKMEKPFPMLAPDDPPYFPETWPGKICALCNLSERSQLGQREMIRLSCPDGFTPRKTNPSPGQSPSSASGGDKSPRGQTPHQISHRRQKSKEGKSSCEVLDELSVVGYVEEPDVNSIFEPSGTFYVHLSCIVWSDGVSRNESDLQIENHGPVVLQGLSRRCSYCSRFGASVMCSYMQSQTNCGLYFHYPCTLAIGGFMDNKTKTLICNLHLDQVPLLPIGETSQCATCLSLGNVSNILMCTTCGAHHHGSCVGLALLPGVRAGWQCFECRVCQVCRQPSEIGKIMLCESCDKAYHPGCLRPIVTSIPKYGWKCKCCRVCSDCGSRTPGSGLSSRWHNHFSVCDSCYQQRNKGYCCPACGRAYRAAAHREMVQCTKCRKYVHGSCDNDADLAVYTAKKEANPEYEYMCPPCKNTATSGRQTVKRKDSFDEALLESSLSASQESLYGDDSSGMEVDNSPSESKSFDDYPKSIGLGKGKPFCSSNLAKKRFMSRPKGQQSGGGKSNYQKMKKMAECNSGNKKKIKTKMRGVFGVPGLGLQRPQADPTNKTEDEPGVENRMVLCSGSDKFVLSQDICVMCGALGTDQEGCLIACAQCGQCYHPYCVNVKVTKVILQKGWRCLDCTVCEGCGQRNDDSRLTLCDDCDISYHIYCMDPPLDYVPRGVWKCKWCVVCIRCGAQDPGFNCNWMNGFTECGPCSSHTSCPSCMDPYSEGELVIQCEQCERWLHGSCDGIRNEADAEKCADERYTCLLCRPRDVPPPHMVPALLNPKPIQKPPTPTKSPELPRFSQTQFLVDGVCLSESGMLLIKSLAMEQQVTQRKKRTAKRITSLLPSPVMDKEARFLATIESVVSGTEGKSPPPTSPTIKEEEDGIKEEIKEEPIELYKEGMEVAPREDGKPPEPPEGFTIVTTESGIMVLRKKRTRNLQKLGIGGFLVRFRSNRKADEDEDPAAIEKQASTQSMDKPKRKPVRRKPRNKLVESFPSYLQEAFFGRELLDTPKEKELQSSSEDETFSKFKVTDDKTIELSTDELKVMEDVKARQEKEEKQKAEEKSKLKDKSPIKTEEDDGSDSEVLKDLNLKDLPLPGDLLDTDLVNTIMAEDDIKTGDNLDGSELNESLETSGTSQSKDELTDILSPHFNLESMVRESGLPNMDSKDVEEIFKGVLTDESQESQQGFAAGLHLNVQPSIPAQSILPSSFPPPSPYHSEYSNSPHSQVSEPPSPWLDESPMAVEQGQSSSGQSFGSSRSTPAKLEADEPLGLNATISSVLYANTNHPEWKKQYPVWSERCKQITKKWRSLTTDQKAPYLQKARDNRSVLRMKKAQQIPKESPTSTTSPSGSAVAKGSPSGEQKNLIPTTVSQQTTGEGEVCEAAASEQAALKTQSLTTNTPILIGSDDRSSSAAPVSDEKSIVSTSSESGSQTEGTPLKNPAQVENKAVRVLLTPVDNSQARPQNILFRNVVIANNPNIVNPNHNFTIHHHFSGVGATTPSQYVQNEPIIIASQAQPQQTSSFNVRNILGQSNQNVIQFPNYTRFPSHFHLDISNRAPNVTIRAFETGGLSHLTRSQISSHGQAFIHRPMTLTLPQSHTSTHISEIKILHPASHILHTPQVIHSQVQSPSNVETKSEEPDNKNPSPQELSENIRTSEPESHESCVQTRPESTPSQDDKINDILADKIVGFNRLLIVSDQANHQSKVLESKIQIVPQKEEEKAETNEPNDHQIRVLTPSEIMRTLPSLGPDGYDVSHPSQTTSPTPPNHSHMDQEKALQQQKATRESEQERHWKQMQALRQAQAQQQQQVIQEQRVQAMARINRQMSAGEEPNPNLTIQLQVSTAQDPNTLGPLASPSPGSRSQFPQNSSVKVTRIHPSQSPSPFSHPLAPPSPLLTRPIRTPTPNYQSRQFSPNQTSPLPDFPGTPSPNSETDPYTASRTFANQSPRNVFSPQSPRPPPPQPRPPVMFADANRRPEEGYPVGQPGQSPEVTRQLRDLLQRQKDGAAGLGAPPMQRQWPPGPVTDQFPEGQEATFRHPLPPGNIPRPRMPVQQLLVRAPIRQIGDPRMQGVQDQRMRLLIQQQRPQGVQPGGPQGVPGVQGVQGVQGVPGVQGVQAVQGVPGVQGVQTIQGVQNVQGVQGVQGAFVGQQNPQRGPLDPYDEMVQQRQPDGSVLQQRLVPVRMRPTPGAANAGVIATAQSTAPSAEQQEIPESVTAELEQLEQEGGPMAEVEAVSAILGDLGDDDDELLAEMGADFNILEYVDTETSHGDKTNILDNLELEDDETKEKKLLKDGNAGRTNLGKTLPPPTPGQINKPTPEPPPASDVPSQSAKPTETPQAHPGADLALPQISTDDLRTEGLEPRFPTSLPRVPVPAVPVTVDPQRLPMRMGSAPGSARVIVGPAGQIIQGLPVQTRIGGIAVAPPPPPYPGPPPPYPGPQMPPGRYPMGLMPPQDHLPLHLQRRPLLLQEQPLLLEELLEQEKREQEKQQHQTSDSTPNAMVADLDVDHMRETPSSLPSTGMIPQPGMMGAGIRPQFQRPPGPYMQGPPRPVPEAPPQPPRVPPFNATMLPAPPVPPDVITTDQDRQAVMEYENWLNHQNSILQQQLKYYETEVGKLRKVRKSLNSKQRQLRKNGNELSEQDALELQRISTEQAGLQKHLDSSRKSVRQHGVLFQEFRNKQQKQRQNSPLHAGSSPLNQPSHSPLHTTPTGNINPSQSPMHIGAQTTSPMHVTPSYNTSSHPNTPQSPMMSPSPSPMHSPGPVVSQAPGAGMLHSPMSPHSMQQSPRLGTPHSQGEESPFSPGSLPSPGPGRLASPQTPTPGNPRLPSPQHRGRLTTSPGLPDQMNRLHQMNLNPRFVRAPLGPDARLRGPGPQPSATVYQGPGTARVIYTQKAPTQDQVQTQVPQRTALTREQIQRNMILHQQQQQQLRNQQILHQISQQNPNLTPEQKQKLLQFHQQKQQQQQQQQQLAIQHRQQLIDQQMIQQQQQLAAQNQQRIIQTQSNAQNVPISSPQRIAVVQNSHNIHGLPQSSQNSPRSPIVSGQNPKSPISPMIQMPQSPMNLPPKSPVGPPSIQKSPMVQQQTSPLVQSPLNLPPRSPSVGSPLNKHPGFMAFGNSEGLMSHEEKQDNSEMDHGGGNRNAPIPYLDNARRVASFKLGLRGGSPMWSFAKGKRPKRTEEGTNPHETSMQGTRKSPTAEKQSTPGILKSTPLQRVIRQTNVVHPEPSTSRNMGPADSNQMISVLRHRKDAGLELHQQGIVVQLQSSQQLQLQPNQQKVIIQQVPSGNLPQKSISLQKNVQIMQGQKLMQKKLAGSPQIVSKRASLVCVDYDSLDEETPPASPSLRGEKLEPPKEPKSEEKTEEEEEEIRIATDAEGLELLAQENLLNLELEESDEGNGRRVIIIDNSEEGTSGSEKYEDNPNGSPTVMEFMDDDLMVYEPIEGVISDSDELVVLEECEVLEAHEIDISNCEVMEFESVDENEGQDAEESVQAKSVEEPIDNPESIAKDLEESKEVADDSKPEQQKQQIIVRHTRKGKQIVMVKRGQEGKDQRHVVYRSDKDSKDGDVTPVLSRSSSEEEKSIEEIDIKDDVEIIPKESDLKKLIELSEIIIVDENGELPNKDKDKNKVSVPEEAKKTAEIEAGEGTASEKFADSPLSPEPVHEKVLSPVKVVLSGEGNSDPNLSDPRLNKLKPNPQAEDLNRKPLKRSEAIDLPKLPEVTISNLPFPDIPEGLASKFFPEASAEKGRNEEKEPKEPEAEVKKDPELDQTSVIKAPKTYEKSKFGKSKVQLSEHDYTHIPGKTEVFKKDETTEEKEPTDETSVEATTKPDTTPSQSRSQALPSSNNTSKSPSPKPNVPEPEKPEGPPVKLIPETKPETMPPSSRHQANIGIPGVPRPTIAYPTVPPGSGVASIKKHVLDFPSVTEKETPNVVATTAVVNLISSVTTPVVRTTTFESKTETTGPVMSEISSHMAKIDPKVRDIISISKITTLSKDVITDPSISSTTVTTCNVLSSTTLQLSTATVTSTIISTPRTSVPILTSLCSLKPSDNLLAKSKPKNLEEAKKSDARRKSLDAIGRRKSIEERRRSSEATVRENKRELEQRKQMILEEIKQSQLEKEKLKLKSLKQAETNAEVTKTEHDLSDVIDILENIDSTPTRLLNASELQSIDKTQLFENEELEKTPPLKPKLPEPPKYDEKINLQSLLSDTGKSDIQVSDLARGLSKPMGTPEPRSIPPANTQSKLAALLTGGSDAMRSKTFPGSAPGIFERKDNVPTLESLLEKDIESAKKMESGDNDKAGLKAEKEESQEKSESAVSAISPSHGKTDNLNIGTSSTSGNLILSPTSGIFRSSGSNLGVPASKILSPSTGITLSVAEHPPVSEGEQGTQADQKGSEPQRQAQGILLSSGQSIIQQNTIVSSSPVVGTQQGIIINDRTLGTTVGNSPGVLMTTRLLQPVAKNNPNPSRSSPLSVLPPGVRQQIITANYIQQNRASPVLVRRISTPSPPRVRTPPQTQPHNVTTQNSVISHPALVQLNAQSPQNTYQRTFRAVSQNVSAAVLTTSTVTTSAMAFTQTGVRLPGPDMGPRIVVSSGNQLIASSQLQRLSVSQGLSIPSAVMSTSINPSSLNADQRTNQQRMYGTDMKYSQPDGILLQANLNIVKTEPLEIKEEKFTPNANLGNKFPRTDESQNVLLKQLLQNTACAGSTTASPTTSTSQTTSSATLPSVPSLEAQLARPVPPTPSSLIPTLLTEQKSTSSSPTQMKPVRGPAPPNKDLQRPAVIGLESRRISQSNRTPSREDLLSPTNSTRSSFGLRTPSPITSPQAGVVSIKQEKMPQCPVPEIEIKKELPDEVKQEPNPVADRISQEQAAIDLKKLKRRQYQQKRRQSQGKEGMTGGTPKKRARKGSRMEEDYESYTENLMTQLRQLPALSVLEPVLGKNYNVCGLFGGGDHSKLNMDLKGAYGNAVLPTLGDYYTTKPFGDKEKPPPASPVSTQRGFYDQEFSVIQLSNDSDEKKLEALLLGSRERDTDTPDTVISSSSPECVIYEPSPRFPALQLIKDEMLSDEEISRASPVIPIIAPIPIRLKPGQTLKEYKESDKENTCVASGFKKNSNSMKEGNVTVTLTLNSEAAQDILGVLKDLANILHIPAPTAYQIIERTATPPSIKLGLYRNKGKDGKEGVPVDIQSILNGQAKFCRHCDVVILNNMIRKKVSELPFLSERDDIIDNTEELYFCSSACYMQFSLMHKSPNMSQDKAATVVDHMSGSSAKKLRLSADEKENKCKVRDAKKDSEAKKPNKGHRYKYWQPGALMPSSRYKRQSERELMEMLFRVGVTLTPSQNSDDTRRCLFCHQLGDGVADGTARLLNFDVDKWVHLNCALWSDDVYETVNGALMNVDNALQLGQTTTCSLCNQNGATIHCFKLRCSNVYHLGCAVKDECVFFKNKTTYCPAHVPKNEKDNELTTLSVYRRVYVQRDENRQVATVMHHTDQHHLLRVGSLIFLNVGQLLPHQLPVFHTPNYIYPVGYKIVRFYWSMRRPNKRCKYICSIHDTYGRPEFRILVQEPTYDDIELRDSSPKAVWARILEPLQQLRKDNANVQIFPRYVTGEDLFGLNEPAVVRVLESLPGVETLTDYKFKYGRNPLLELPLAVNPTGCARSEPRLKNLVPYKRPHTQRTAATSRPNLFSPSLPGLSNEAMCPYSKQFVHSKSSQYKKMKLEWRNNVYLARSKIQGLGLYAARDLERHTMVIEYIGEIIRHELSESREKQYEARNRGIYMFRLDEERVIDATISGGLARYINHSCNPNCVAEIVEVDRDLRIIIFAKRRITRGEELAYDYKFDIEDDQHKIPCLCGAPNCRKWMN